jgi:hypothetical protein
MPRRAQLAPARELRDIAARNRAHAPTDLTFRE